MTSAVGAIPPHPLHRSSAAVPAPQGDIPVRVYWPSDADNLPVLVWFHGGGWVLGSLDTHDNHCRLLSEAVDVVVVSVDYRLAARGEVPRRSRTACPAWTWVTANARAERRSRPHRHRWRQRRREPRGGDLSRRSQ